MNAKSIMAAVMAPAILTACASMPEKAIPAYRNVSTLAGSGAADHADGTGARCSRCPCRAHARLSNG